MGFNYLINKYLNCFFIISDTSIYMLNVVKLSYKTGFKVSGLEFRDKNRNKKTIFNSLWIKNRFSKF